MGFKILVNSTFGGGAEIQAALLARALKPDAFLVLDGPPGGVAQPLAQWCSGLPGALKTLLLRHYARRLAAQTGPGDTVLSFMQRSNFVNVLAARSNGHRAVICEVTQPSREFTGLRGKIIKPLISRLYPEAALTLANSKGNARDLEENFGFAPGKIKVIYNACDIAGVRAQAALFPDGTYGEIFKRPVIITSGRLTAAKAHWRLLRIFAEVKKGKPDAALVLLGEGELRQQLLGLCAALGLKAYDAKGAAPMTGKEDVFFAGFQEHPYKFFSRAKVFAFTSLWEGLPNAVIEALACGLPVISSDCRSGPRELLAPGTDFAAAAVMPEETATGLLMPPFKVTPPEFDTETDGREKLWAEKILELLADAPRLAKLRRACEDRAEAFSLPKKTAEWHSLLRGQAT
ncbi:MAG TPA: glycosyltransferase [Elusimicrobiales bacterium]|nr:glycosyltransferase [Elusimicrobiales bacterium]